jgi:hypothetical protein
VARRVGLSSQRVGEHHGSAHFWSHEMEEHAGQERSRCSSLNVLRCACQASIDSRPRAFISSRICVATSSASYTVVSITMSIPSMCGTVRAKLVARAIRSDLPGHRSNSRPSSRVARAAAGARKQATSKKSARTASMTLRNSSAFSTPAAIKKAAVPPDAVAEAARQAGAWLHSRAAAVNPKRVARPPSHRSPPRRCREACSAPPTQTTYPYPVLQSE